MTTVTPAQAHLHLRADATYPFDARGVAKRFRHAAIFGALDVLQGGEAMDFINDHDPLPLLEQLHSRYGDHLEWAYLERGPQMVRIRFSKKG
ncbi:DUF2249 domain-containing protein [Acidithiobacillus sp.]